MSAVGAIPGRCQESLHHHCSVPPEEAPLGQSNSDSPVCSGPSSERPLTGNHPVEEVRITFKVFYAILPGTLGFLFPHVLKLISNSHPFLGRLSGMLQHLLPADQDIQRELVRFNVDLTVPSFKEGESIVEWWGHHVFDKPDKYSSLSAMVKCCLSIFHGPRVESSFLNDVIDQRSGNMNVPTFIAIQTVKYTLQSRGKTAVQLFRREDVKFGEVDRTLQEHQLCSSHIQTPAADESEGKAAATEQVWLPSIWQCSAGQERLLKKRKGQG